MFKFHHREPTAALVLVFVLSIPSIPASAHEEQESSVEETVVYGRAKQQLGTARSASEGFVGATDLQLVPFYRVGELAESVPGLIATQHSGTGKANQFYLRGFNLDHGTDFSGYVDDIPVNTPSHGHGQGYLDLNFLIPELVASANYTKGPYHAEVGDFATAGNVRFSSLTKLERNQFKLSLGENGHRRALLLGSKPLLEGNFIAALEVTRYSGPWQLDEDLRQEKAHLGLDVPIGNTSAQFRFYAYSGDWMATDQIPDRAIRSGLIDIDGTLDTDLGGTTDRFSLSAKFSSHNWALNLYAVDYDFSLTSNFTYFLDDPINGDEFTQVDDRRVYGSDFQWNTNSWLAWGISARIDDVQEVGLFNSVGGVKVTTVRLDELDVLALGVWVQTQFQFANQWRAEFGLRGDYHSWDVDAQRAANSGGGRDRQLSPKFNLAYLVSPALELYASAGRGFHSNDVRGAEISVDPATGESADTVPVLSASQGAEIGFRYENGDRFNLSAAAFVVGLDSELLFVGDAGNTEALGRSRREGIELNTFWQISNWLSMNFSYTWVDAKLRDDVDDAIPNALDETASLGINAAWPNGLFASVRARHLGESALIEDDSVRAPTSTLVNMSLGYTTNTFEYRLDLFNALNSDDFDISYFYASRLPGEAAPGIEDVHFRPLEPRNVRFSVSYSW